MARYSDTIALASLATPPWEAPSAADDGSASAFIAAEAPVEEDDARNARETRAVDDVARDDDTADTAPCGRDRYRSSFASARASFDSDVLLSAREFADDEDDPADRRAATDDGGAPDDQARPRDGELGGDTGRRSTAATPRLSTRREHAQR